MVLRPGTRLGPYEVTALIGQGGMGDVYNARDTLIAVLNKLVRQAGAGTHTVNSC